MRKQALPLALLLALPSVAGADEADAHYRAGLAFKQQNKTDEAIQEFQAAIKLRSRLRGGRVLARRRLSR